MNTLYPHPTPRRRFPTGNSKIVVLLLWGSILFFLLLPPLYKVIGALGVGWPAGTFIPHGLMALVAASLLGILTAATLIAQLRGYRVSVWILLPALLLFAALWWE